MPTRRAAAVSSITSRLATFLKLFPSILLSHLPLLTGKSHSLQRSFQNTSQCTWCIGSRQARFEEHLRVLLGQPIKQWCWSALEVLVEKRQRVGIDRGMSLLPIARAGQAGPPRKWLDHKVREIRYVRVKHLGNGHQVAITRQTVVQ